MTAKTKRANPERAVQIKIITWLRAVMPKVMIQHSKNEHYKRGQAGKIAGSMNKHAGVMSGFPDLICLPYAHVGPFFIEVKAPKGTVQPVQVQVHDMLRERGYPVCVARSIDDVREFLQREGIGFNEVQFNV